MARPAHGTKEKTRDGYWRPRITLNNGTQVRLKPFKRKMSSEDADELVAEIARRARDENWTAAPKAVAEATDAVKQWFSRWNKARKEGGYTTTAPFPRAFSSR